jgi:hypothetical protein
MYSPCICSDCEKLALGAPVVRSWKGIALEDAFVLCTEREIPFRNRVLRYAFVHVGNMKNPKKRKEMMSYLAKHTCIY